MNVAVIGAAGHVGFPFSLVCARAGHKVWGIDVNKKACDDLNRGIVPFIEDGAQEILAEQLDNKNLFFTENPSYIKQCDIVAIMLGTPVDHENNPRLDFLFNFVDYTLMPFMKKGTLVLLRSEEHTSELQSH